MQTETDPQTILVMIPIGEGLRDAIMNDYQIYFASPGLADVSETARRAVTVVITNGSTGISAQDISILPRLALIICTGTGYENVALAAARQSGAVVANTPGANSETVADHALCLMLALARDLPRRHAAVKALEWEAARTPARTLHDAVVGILGLGSIGRLIAQRTSGGFGARTLYHARRKQEDVKWEYEPDLLAMARRSDFLVAACPGGAETHHLINGKVLASLGSEGFLVNVSRGSVVDSEALIAALATGGIAGAALDVFEGEPNVPDALLAFENVILTPHMAGRSPATVHAQIYHITETLRRHFSGDSVPTPIT